MSDTLTGLRLHRRLMAAYRAQGQSPEDANHAAVMQMSQRPTDARGDYAQMDDGPQWHRIQSHDPESDACVIVCAGARVIPLRTARYIPPASVCEACRTPRTTTRKGDDMPKVSEMKTSKYLKREDVGEEGTLVTIVNVHQTNVAMEGKEPDMKWCMTVAEFEKPLILNFTNATLCEKFLGSDDTDDWTGKKIVLYDDPAVMFGGEMVGGIRVRRAPTGRPAKPSPTRQREPGDDDAPWPNE